MDVDIEIEYKPEGTEVSLSVKAPDDISAEEQKRFDIWCLRTFANVYIDEDEYKEVQDGE